MEPFYLFGSRVDDNRRGGDIDLLVETPSVTNEEAARARIRYLAKLKQRIGEQRIDLIVHASGESNPPTTARAAHETGIRL